MIDLGDDLDFSVTVTDDNGNLANATNVALTITSPTTVYVSDPVTPSPTGIYAYSRAGDEEGHWVGRWVATGTNASTFPDEIFNVERAASRAIMGLADVRARLGKTDNATDEELRRVIYAATDFVESQIGPVVRRTVTEVIYPSSGLLLLTQAPVISLTSVAGANGYTTTYSVGTLYLDGDAGIVRPAYGGYGFTYPVTVTYVAGRAVVPALIQEAALDYVEWLWQARRGASPLPLQGEEFDSSVPMTVPNKIVQALAPYRSSVIA